MPMSPGLGSQSQSRSWTDLETIKYGSGTFFVSPTTLITAAHIVPDGNRKIVAHTQELEERLPLLTIFSTLLARCIAKRSSANVRSQDVQTLTSRFSKFVEHTRPRHT